MPIEISPERLPLCTRHRHDLPGLHTPYMHLFPCETHWYCRINNITLQILVFKTNNATKMTRIDNQQRFGSTFTLLTLHIYTKQRYPDLDPSGF